LFNPLVRSENAKLLFLFDNYALDTDRRELHHGAVAVGKVQHAANRVVAFPCIMSAVTSTCRPVTATCVGHGNSLAVAVSILLVNLRWIATQT
jgi:hypothetical protein